MDNNTSKAHVAAAGPTDPLAGGSGAGSALFVINLCASIAPVEIAGRNIPGLENYRLYQVARVEDGRTRHRLRLGFFTSESHAQSVLTVVRQQYPTAFTACLCNEDRRFARGYLPQAPAAAAKQPPAPVAKPLAPPAATTRAAAPAVETAAKAAPAPVPSAKPAAARVLAPAEPEVIELTWEPEQPVAPKQAPAVTRPEAPSRGTAVPATAGLDELTWEPPTAKPTPAAKRAASTSDTAKHPILKTAAQAQPAAKAPATPAKPKGAATMAGKVDTAASMRVRTLELSLEAPAPIAAKPKRNGPVEPFHVGKGVEIAELGISLQTEPAAARPALPTAPAPSAKTPANKPVAKAAAPTPKPAKKSTQPNHAPVVPKAAQHVAASARAVPAPLPELDSTQTIRALTSAELEDEQQEKWFAVQLTVSQQPVNLDAMPRLDIFEAYRLYSVASAGSGRIIHSLRLGFFKEAVSAEAVCGYLKTFFGTPSVLRVSVAEHARFKDPPSKKPAAQPKHEAKVVELNARAARPLVPTVTMEVTAPQVDTAATGSFKMSTSGGTAQHAAKSSGTAIKRASAASRTGATGKHKALPKKSLAEQLLEEAREVELSESGIRKLPKNDSLLSRLVEKLTK